jgi:ATP-dependent DNA ligase
MVIPQPMPLVQQPQPFDDWDWIYEIKHDGFRALAVIEQGQCRLFSRKKHLSSEGFKIMCDHIDRLRPAGEFLA